MRANKHFKWIFIITCIQLALLSLLVIVTFTKFQVRNSPANQAFQFPKMFKVSFGTGQAGSEMSIWPAFQKSLQVNPDVFKYLHPYNPALPTNYSQAMVGLGTMKVCTDKLKTMSNFIINRFNKMTGGFFIEVGAYDGLWLSNTVMLEKDYGWTGLLIEADPKISPILIQRNRKAYVADVCLSLTNAPMKVNMGGESNGDALSFIGNNIIGKNQSLAQRKFEAQCYPLHMLLDAIGKDYVDYFSLDVEGVELNVLKSIPWERIRIKVISVEFREGSRAEIKTFLELQGYTRINQLYLGNECMQDDVYELID